VARLPSSKQVAYPRDTSTKRATVGFVGEGCHDCTIFNAEMRRCTQIDLYHTTGWELARFLRHMHAVTLAQYLSAGCQVVVGG
jgi:hypothetical protein